MTTLDFKIRLLVIAIITVLILNIINILFDCQLFNTSKSPSLDEQLYVDGLKTEECQLVF